MGSIREIAPSQFYNRWLLLDRVENAGFASLMYSVQTGDGTLSPLRLSTEGVEVASPGFLRIAGADVATTADISNSFTASAATNAEVLAGASIAKRVTPANMGAVYPKPGGTCKVVRVSKGAGATDTRAGIEKDDPDRPYASVNEAVLALADGDELIIEPCLENDPYPVSAPLELPALCKVTAYGAYLMREEESLGAGETAFWTNRDWEAGNEGIAIYGGVYDINAENNTRADLIDVGPGGVGFRFKTVNKLILRDVEFRNQMSFAVMIGATTNFTIENAFFNNDFTSADYPNNTDGIHVSGNCHYGVIKNIYGRTGDDIFCIATENDNVTAPFFELSRGPCSDILVDGVRADLAWSCGRLLSAAEEMNHITIRNLSGKVYAWGLVIGNNGHDELGTGNFKSITIEGVNVAVAGIGSQPGDVIVVDSDVETLKIRDLAEDSSFHATFTPRSGNLLKVVAGTTINTLIVDGWSFTNPYTESRMISSDDAETTNLIVSNCLINYSGGSAPQGAAFYLGEFRRAVFNNIITTNVYNIIDWHGDSYADACLIVNNVQGRVGQNLLAMSGSLGLQVLINNLNLHTFTNVVLGASSTVPFINIDNIVNSTLTNVTQWTGTLGGNVVLQLGSTYGLSLSGSIIANGTGQTVSNQERRSGAALFQSTVDVVGAITRALNQNDGTLIHSTNTTANTNSYAGFRATTSGGGMADFQAASASHTYDSGSMAARAVVYANASLSNGVLLISEAGTVRVRPAKSDAAVFDSNASAGNTRLLLWDVDTGALQRVKVGANGTGPSGADRMLYIAASP